MKTIIIAEAGVNHNGSIEKAKALVDAASVAGADYVKFQTFKASKLVTQKAQLAEYQKNNTSESSQYEMLKTLELSVEQHHILKAYASEKNIKFLSTGFDEESIDFLVSLGMDFLKIPSGEITNYPYLRHMAQKNLPIIISTGMSDLNEVKAAIQVLLAHGCSKSNITVLHCNTEYPTPFADVNLKAMHQIAEECEVEIGYSDHTLGIEISIAAVALGATVIEKHFTLDRTLPGPDHKASLEPNELKQLVQSIRNVELALAGNGIKEQSVSEEKNKGIARKSIHVNKNLVKGSVIQESDLITLRPGIGINPMEWNSIIGKKLSQDLEANHMLTYSDFE